MAMMFALSLPCALSPSMRFSAASRPRAALSDSTECTRSSTEGSGGPSKVMTGTPACLACWMPRIVALLSSKVITMASGFWAIASRNCCTCSVGESVSICFTSTPAPDISSVKTLLKCPAQVLEFAPASRTTVFPSALPPPSAAVASSPPEPQAARAPPAPTSSSAATAPRTRPRRVRRLCPNVIWSSCSLSAPCGGGHVSAIRKHRRGTVEPWSGVHWIGPVVEQVTLASRSLSPVAGAARATAGRGGCPGAPPGRRRGGARSQRSPTAAAPCWGARTAGRLSRGRSRPFAGRCAAS
jgi:hypothetical protein